MISIFTGKPGAGKTYGALLEIIRELEMGSRDIVTNVSLDLNALNEYFQRPGRPFVDVFSRLRVIDKECAREFWRFRGRFTVLPDARLLLRSALSTAHDGSGASVSALSELVADDGVLYVIDEAHILFDARQWQKSAASLTFYNSQHRKLRDELIFVTQFMKLLESRVRGFAEQFRVYRNFVGAKAYNILSMPPRMREIIYSVEPAPGVDPDYEIWRKLNPEIAACYDTSGGVGVSGGRKPEARKTRGFSLPWWTVLIAVVLFGIFLTQVPGFIAKRVGNAIVGGKTPVAYTPPAVQNPLAAKETPTLGNVANDSVPTKTVKVTGVLMKGRTLRVNLDDGRTLVGAQVAALYTDRVVTVTGDTFYLVKPGRAEPGARSTKRPL